MDLEDSDPEVETGRTSINICKTCLSLLTLPVIVDTGRLAPGVSLNAIVRSEILFEVYYAKTKVP